MLGYWKGSPICNKIQVLILIVSTLSILKWLYIEAKSIIINVKKGKNNGGAQQWLAFIVYTSFSYKYHSTCQGI